eukprot:5898883-Prymnesium_polylepis.1
MRSRRGRCGGGGGGGSSSNEKANEEITGQALPRRPDRLSRSRSRSLNSSRHRRRRRRTGPASRRSSGGGGRLLRGELRGQLPGSGGVSCALCGIMPHSDLAGH